MWSDTPFDRTGRLRENIARYRMEMQGRSHSDVGRLWYGIGIRHHYMEHHTGLDKFIIEYRRVQ